VLTAINDFSLWFFVWDDRHDHDIRHRRGSAWSRLREALHLALDDPGPARDDDDPLVRAFADCVTRLGGTLSDRWRTRFARHFHDTIEAYDQEYRNRTRNVLPTVEEYLALRRHTFGMWVWLDCLELAAGCELPDRVRAGGPYQWAGLASQEFSAWYNDLYSMPKELAAGDFHNFGIVLARQENLPIQQAADHLAGRIRDRIADYRRAERAVRRYLDETDADPRVRAGTERCLFNMRNWMSSVHAFHHVSGRYQVASWDDPANPPYFRDGVI
jgi:epi-isozizaene synthase